MQNVSSDPGVYARSVSDKIFLVSDQYLTVDDGWVDYVVQLLKMELTAARQCELCGEPDRCIGYHALYE